MIRRDVTSCSVLVRMYEGCITGAGQPCFTTRIVWEKTVEEGDCDA